MLSASAIRLQIETALAHMIPSALTPTPKIIRPLVETGIEPLDHLLDGGLPEPGRLDLTLAWIAASVGEGNVRRAVLEDTHALEGFRMEAFQVPSSDSEMAVPAMPRASLRLLRPCERARVILRNTQPSVFFFREQQYTVERAYGPWWDSVDWWNSNLWGFEQWDLVARGPDGTLLCCCLMRDLMQNEWQMAALYD